MMIRIIWVIKMIRVIRVISVIRTVKADRVHIIIKVWVIEANNPINDSSPNHPNLRA
jgi:hypothetical protein